MAVICYGAAIDRYDNKNDLLPNEGPFPASTKLSEIIDGHPEL
jgi:hypothetical protein